MSGSESHDKHELDDAVDIQSQAGDIADRESSPTVSMITQTAFATQVKGERRGIECDARTNSLENPSSKGAAFLDRLMASGNITIGRSDDDVSTATVIARTIVNAQTTSALQPVSEARKGEISSRLDSKANSQTSILSSGIKEWVNPPTKANSPPASNPNLGDDSEKENSQDSLKEKVSSSNPNKEPVAETHQRNVSDVFNAQIPEDNQFEGMKRIPRSYVRIPKNQQALLASSDSWWRPESSSRASCAKIPPEVVQQLNSFIGRNQDERNRDNTLERSNAAETGRHIGQESESDDQCSEDASNEGDNLERSFSQVDRSQEPIYDDESVGSWELSQYGDPEADNPPAMPDPSQGDLARARVAMTGVDLSNTTPSLLSGQEPSLPAPLKSNVPVASKTKSSFDYKFPSSSPGHDEELELAVPHAIGDEVDESHPDIDEEEVLTLELPSTAVGHKTVIQIEQTPNPNVPRVATTFSTGSQPHMKHQPISIDARNIDGHVSSDPIIPATCDDDSQERLSFSTRNLPASTENRSGFENYFAEEQQYSLQEDDHEKKSGSFSAEDEMLERQICEELKSSQLVRGEAVHSSPPPTSPHTSPKIPGLDSPNKTVVRNASALLRSLQPPTPSSFHDASSEGRPESETTSSCPGKLVPLQQSDGPEAEGGNSCGPRFAQCLVAKASQTQSGFVDIGGLRRAGRSNFFQSHPSDTETSFPKSDIRSHRLSPTSELPDFRDTSNLAKANRQNFRERSWSRNEEQTVVQIAQSQPNAITIDQTSPVHSSADPIFAQSSTDLVRSSIPQREVVSPKSNKGELPTTPTKEPSLPAALHSSGSSVDSRVILGTSRQPDNSVMALLPLTTQRPRQREIRKEDTIDIVSINSDSDFNGIPNEEQDDEDPPNEIVALEDIPDGKHMIDVPEEHQGGNPESVKSQQDFIEATAFEKFKSVYPSYGGKEKNFIWALVYIEWLVENKGQHFLRASLWDDFIRFLTAEYLEHIETARLSGDRMMTGFEYFNMLDQAPIFQQRLMTPYTLKRSLPTLEPAQLRKFRLRFNISTPVGVNLSRPQSSHGPPSVASQNSRTIGSQRTSIASVLVDVAEPSAIANFPEPKFAKAPEDVCTKRPFFETPSQLPVAKKPRAPSTPSGHEDDANYPRTTKSRRSLPWPPKSSTPPASKPLEKPSTAMPANSSRIGTKSLISTSGQKLTPSISFSGGSPSPSSIGITKPRFHSSDTRNAQSRYKDRPTTYISPNRDSLGSPILGRSTPISRSFDVNDIRFGSIGTPIMFKKPSAPVSKAALIRQGDLARSKTAKVEGWLDHTEPQSSRTSNLSTTTPKLMPRKDSIKRKRDSGLELLDLQPSGSETKTRRVSTPVNKTMTSSSGSRMSNAGSVTSSLGKKPPFSYKEFLEKKSRERRLSTPISKVASASGSGKRVDQRSIVPLEPETQAWGS